MPKSKPWNRSSRGRSSTPARKRRRVLIVCEDAKSSRYYLERFPVDKQRIEITVLGTGMNTDSLVAEAIERAERAARNREPYSDVWCVFDRDSFPLANYSRALLLAATHRIKVAWANEAFELWYLLHYCYLDAAIGRADYQGKLREFGLDYDKADKAIYGKLELLQATAIKNAARLEKHWNDAGAVYPERNNPSTGIHKLVEYLNELAALGSAE